MSAVIFPVATSRSDWAFTPEFEAEIVGLCGRGDRSAGHVAKDVEPTETAVRDRVEQAGADAGEHGGPTSGDHEELTASRRANRRLREDVDALKRATALFAKETRWRCTRSSRRRSRQAQRQTGVCADEGLPDRGTHGAPRVHAVLKREAPGAAVVVSHDRCGPPGCKAGTADDGT